MNIVFKAECVQPILKTKQNN